MSARPFASVSAAILYTKHAETCDRLCGSRVVLHHPPGLTVFLGSCSCDWRERVALAIEAALEAQQGAWLGIWGAGVTGEYVARKAASAALQAVTGTPGNAVKEK